MPRSFADLAPDHRSPDQKPIAVVAAEEAVAALELVDGE